MLRPSRRHEKAGLAILDAPGAMATLPICSDVRGYSRVRKRAFIMKKG